MTTTDDSHCVAVFDRHEDSETAIRELQRCGFDVKKLSSIGRDYHTEEQAVGFYKGGDRVKYWGKQGAFGGSVFVIHFAQPSDPPPPVDETVTCSPCDLLDGDRGDHAPAHHPAVGMLGILERVRTNRRGEHDGDRDLPAGSKLPLDRFAEAEQPCLGRRVDDEARRSR
jgi:hypothetical protein